MAVAACALFAGMGLSITVDWLCRRERTALQLPPVAPPARWYRGAFVVIVAVLLYGLYHWASFDQRCLDIDEVQPSGPGRNWRFVYHLILIGFLILATAVDFDCYMIPDEITIPGMLTGVFGACLIGDAQICHLWVDWSVAVPQLRGPLIPAWYDSHRAWHAISWSLTGLMAGSSLTWLARKISSQVLGQEAMGFGDVTLMAMIGSFLGWQAVTLVFLIAPLAGLTIGVLVRTLTGKTYLPYGPWLSIAAVIVLFAWKQLWGMTRLIFSDWFSVAVLGAIGGASFVLLLWLIQLYKSIPTRERSASKSGQ